MLFCAGFLQTGDIFVTLFVSLPNADLTILIFVKPITMVSMPSIFSARMPINSTAAQHPLWIAIFSHSGRVMLARLWASCSA